MSFSVKDAAKKVKLASRQLANLSSQEKDAVLMSVAEQIHQRAEHIIAANKRDLQDAEQNGIEASMLDRLMLDHARLQGIADAVREIAGQPDPVGSINNIKRLPSGIQVGKMRIPLGVIAMIYEARPNVTIDAAALCFKAGNGVILRGGKEALHSNLALAECLHAAFEQHGVAADAVVVIPDPDRAIMQELLTLSDDVDLIIPRGGEGLIRYVTANSRIPVIQHYKGVCHLYVDKDADLAKALNILDNGKTQRVSVCNSLETLLVHESIAADFMPVVAQLFAEKSVKVHACEKAISYFDGAEAATEEDWHVEYLALEIAVRIVADYDAAVEHIQEYGSGHTDVIITQDYSTANRFTREINSAVVMVNASSRFSDGGQLGLGAEIGISTSKLHAYGPMGAESLTTEKFVVLGEGQIRG
ncbi:glutamate-5-semialdehyde dehydrogenase [Paraneptunicella aestuarii]|uniref:glutamate-5-semialdehyde dehydrogenase n=1 Tax=Paraneptunicella aestuarii TaxID=2831148 RepID=UPI001E38E771|nr:glutamate-5-semialdehyde dehydrogenase [Paraneptunicella aestuarii]UAA38414.1 glutamate-5-semialdehyde dehydrogenase [Paraneptunicella aestuarii]